MGLTRHSTLGAVRTRIRVCNHISEFVGLDDVAFAGEVERLKRRLARSNPVAALTRRTIGGALEALETAPDRDELLRQALDRNPVGVARAILRELTDMLPPADGSITCHLVPNGGDRGSGNCFGSDRLLAAVPCKGELEPWIRFVVAHEYSHTQRGFRLSDQDAVRDFLIFEGLAMVLAEICVPSIGLMFREESSDEQVTQFWADADFEVRGLDGYMTEMGRDGAYEAGARIIRGYLQRHGISIADAHRRENRELYWESGYPLLR